MGSQVLIAAGFQEGVFNITPRSLFDQHERVQKLWKPKVRALRLRSVVFAVNLVLDKRLQAFTTKFIAEWIIFFYYYF